jgi:tRNA pseudouridine55 synthase
MARRGRGGRQINAWLILDKPGGVTSTQCVNRIKRLTRAEKVGHGGTLDPLATGVLPIAMGEATKTVSYVMDARKTYSFTMRFGESRDTDDAEGVVLATSESRPSDEAIHAALAAFVGDIMQRPPCYAAVKIQGERAYDIARRGDVVELEPRPVRVDRLVMTRRIDADQAQFEMACGKGAYVRAIARDLGEALGCFAHVSELRRTSVGAFSLDQAVALDALDELVAQDSLPQVLVSVATALADIPALALTEPQAHRIRSGQPVRVPPRLVEETAGQSATVRVTQAGELVAIARVEAGELSPVRVFNHKGALVARAQE